MVPDKFNMVDMGCIDLIESQGVAVEGLYQRLVESIALCRYQCLYNWKFNGILIPPSYVEMELREDGVWINEGVMVDENDVIYINTLEPSAPVIQEVSISENGTYTVPSGVDGYNPVVVDVPSTEPMLQSLTVTENGTYLPDTGYDGFITVTVQVSAPAPPKPSLPQGYQEVEYLHLDGSCGFTAQLITKCNYIEVSGEYDSNDYIADAIVGYRQTTTTSSDYNLNYSRWYIRDETYGIKGSVSTDNLFIYSKIFIANDHVNIGCYYLRSDTGAHRFRGKIFFVGCINSNLDGYTHYYIPCRRISDSGLGFYDPISNTFLTNQDSGTVTAGPDVN